MRENRSLKQKLGARGAEHHISIPKRAFDLLVAIAKQATVEFFHICNGVVRQIARNIFHDVIGCDTQNNNACSQDNPVDCYRALFVLGKVFDHVQDFILQKIRS